MFVLHVPANKWWTAWYPEVLLVCAGFVGVYWFLVEPVRRKYRLAERVETKYTTPFLLSMLAIWLAEGTPIHALSEQFLFSVHMVQHILLALVFPPLFIMGFPDWLLRPLFRVRYVLPVARVLTHPVVAIVLFNGVYSAWHLPGAYQAALYNHDVHFVQHLILVFTAILAWWPLVSRSRDLPRLPGPAPLIYLFFFSVAQIATYAYVTFNNQLLYEYYARAPRLWGISPMTDQVLAGIIMKLGSMVVFLPILVVLFFRWVAREEKNAVHRPQPAPRPAESKVAVCSVQDVRFPQSQE